MGDFERHQEAVDRLRGMSLLPPDRVRDLYEQAQGEIAVAEGVTNPELAHASLAFVRALALIVEEEKKAGGAQPN